MWEEGRCGRIEEPVPDGFPNPAPISPDTRSLSREAQSDSRSMRRRRSDDARDGSQDRESRVQQHTHSLQKRHTGSDCLLGMRTPAPAPRLITRSDVHSFQPPLTSRSQPTTRLLPHSPLSATRITGQSPPRVPCHAPVPSCPLSCLRPVAVVAGLPSRSMTARSAKKGCASPVLHFAPRSGPDRSPPVPATCDQVSSPKDCTETIRCMGCSVRLTAQRMRVVAVVDVIRTADKRGVRASYPIYGQQPDPPVLSSHSLCLIP